MDGIHDLGGKFGYGPVDRSTPAQGFAERWEASVFTMTRVGRSCGAIQNTDQFRFAVERIDPVAYLTQSYYGRWLGAVENLLVEAQVISSEELSARVVANGGDPESLVAARPDPRRGPVGAETQPGARRDNLQGPAFRTGQRVRTASRPSPGHTRLPAYARSRVGVIRALHDTWVLPDSNAHGAGEQPTHLYTVEFRGTELWGEDADPAASVCLDLFECYLCLNEPEELEQ